MATISSTALGPWIIHGPDATTRADDKDEFRNTELSNVSNNDALTLVRYARGGKHIRSVSMLHEAPALTDAGLITLAGLGENLTSLTLRLNPNQTYGLSLIFDAVLTKCTKLEHLELEGPHPSVLTKDSIDTLATYGKSLQQLILRFSPDKDAVVNYGERDFKQLSKLTNLTTLRVRGLQNITFTTIVDTASGLPQLKDLMACGSAPTTDKDIAYLAKKIRNLSILALWGSNSLTTSSLGYLGESSLRDTIGVLAIADLTVGNQDQEAWKALAAFTHLLGLSLTHCDMTPQGLDYVLKHIPTLNSITLTKCPISEADGMSIKKSLMSANPQRQLTITVKNATTPNPGMLQRFTGLSINVF